MKQLSQSKLYLINKSQQNKKREIENDSLLYNDNVFVIQPIEGMIWPNSHVDITVLFLPTSANLNTVSAYCEVSGRQSRLSLLLKV
jgi:hydrocephalus-inducing protein